MKSYSLYIVNHSDAESVRATFASVVAVEGTSLLRCGFDRDAEPPDDDVLAGDASATDIYAAQFGEVIFVYGDNSIDGFVYEHVRDGTMVRKLVWFPMLDDRGTYGWVCVTGEPESWESALFRPDTLERLLYNERSRHQDEGRSDDFASFEEQVRADWAAQRIVAGHTYPECDATATALVERYYGVELPL